MQARYPRKNADRIHQHTIALEDVNTQLQASPSGTSRDKAKRRKVLDRQKYHLCELKKAQDAMCKNLNASMATVKELPTKPDTDSNSSAE